MKPVSSKGYRVIDRDVAEQRFAVSTDVIAPRTVYARPDYDQPVRLYEGGLRATELPPGQDNIIVDGDLTVDGELLDGDADTHRFILVTGDLRTRSVDLGERMELVVRGDLHVADHIAVQAVGETPLDGDTRLAARNVHARCLVVRGHVDVVVTGDLTLAQAAWCQDVDDRGSLTVGGRTAVPVLCTGPEFHTELSGPTAIDVIESVSVRDPDGLAVLTPDIFSEHDEDYGNPDYVHEVPERIADAVLAGRPFLRPGQPVAARSDTGPGPDAVIPDPAGQTELDLSHCDLSELPDTIGRLRSLRVLNLSHTKLRRLPDALGDLTDLRVLRAEDLHCPLPSTLGRLGALEELVLSGWRPAQDTAPYAFPAVVTRLPRLRVLDLSGTVLADVPDDLLNVTTLEELNLDVALGHVERLPDLSRLPALRVLKLSGLRGHSDRYPDPALLTRVWSISTLTDLGMDRWGKEPGRPPLTALPADAFVAMRHLRRLDLSFNPLETLPESFYGLADLERVDLRYTRLDRDTIDRLLATFPTATIELDGVAAATDHPVRHRVHELVTTGLSELDADPTRAIAPLEEAVALSAGVRFAGGDLRSALCALVDALDRSHAEAAEGQRQALSDRLVRYGRRALGLIPPWLDTPVYDPCVLVACDALARHLMQRGELDETLSIVDRIQADEDEPEFVSLRRTQVDVLLRLERAGDAYRVAHRVLAHAPDSSDFADLVDDPDFRSWRLADRVAGGFVARRSRQRDKAIEHIGSHAAVITEVDLVDTPLLPVDTLLDLPDLRRLSLAGVDLSGGRLPDGTEVRALLAELGDRGTLEELDLSHTLLPDLPDTVGRLTTLRTLDISGATFHAVPAGIGALAALTVLRARRLPGPVPGGLDQLPALTELDLCRLGRPFLADGGAPTPLPASLIHVPTLRRLRLTGARLASLPTRPGVDAGVETLELSAGLREADRFPDLSGMAVLHTLDLSGNGLTGLPDDVFAATPRLCRLDLRNNRLTALPESLFALTALEDVRIDFARLDAPTLRRLAGLARDAADNPAYDWIRAVIVRLQLKTGRTPDAYRTVARILARRPGFAALADLAGSAAFQAWAASHGPADGSVSA